MSVRVFFQSHLDSIQKSIESLDDAKIEAFVGLIMDCKGKIFFTGVGKNGHVAHKAASTFSSIGIPCFFVDPVDAVHGEMGAIGEDDLLISVSKSGNTEELLTFLGHAKARKCRIVSVHANEGNQSLGYSFLDVRLFVDEEADHLHVVPTSSIAIFTVFLQSVACEVSCRRQTTLGQFVRNHPGGSIGKIAVP